MLPPPTQTPSGMDAEWLTEDWKPSALPESNWKRPSPEDAGDAVLKVIDQTTFLYEQPYHPGHWLARSKALLTLGYPELAIGDAYKAILLCDAAKSDDAELLERVRSAKGMRLKQHAFKAQSQTEMLAGLPARSGLKALSLIEHETTYVLTLALETCTSYQEALDFCREGLRSQPDDHRLLHALTRLSELCMADTAHKGAFTASIYPWMAYELRKRQPETLASAIAHMEGLSGGDLTLAESKIIATKDKRRSRHVRWLDHDIAKPFTLTGRAVAKSFVPAKDFDKKFKLPTKVAVPKSDVLGVFATQDIAEGSSLLVDATVTGAASIKTDNTCNNCYANLTRARVNMVCCDASFCGPLCRSLALASYHRALCSHELHWVQQEAACRPLEHPRSLLLLRFLATALQANVHPLQHEIAAPLTGQYNGEHTSTFTLQESIVTPFRMLRDLGVDIFTDTRYETWVLITLQHRISINKRAEPFGHGGFMVCINPCFSMFNHSCENNATWRNAGSTTVEIRAERDIKKGEEVFLNYGGTGEYLSYWFGGEGCRCPKCRRQAVDH